MRRGEWEQPCAGACVCLGWVVLVSVTSFVQLKVERGTTQILDFNKFLTFLLKAACGAAPSIPTEERIFWFLEFLGGGERVGSFVSV